MSALATQQHRGPDYSALYVGSEDKVLSVQDALPTGERREQVLCGHNRLAILDLSPRSHQPMSSPDGNLHLVFNGEIYNYREIRQELSACGVSFRTEGDTEVLLMALHTWGPSCFARLNGAWACAWYDRRKGELFLSRDRYGKKPLFYHHDGGTLTASSEMKALFSLEQLPRRARASHLATYLLHNRWEAGTRETFYADIAQVPAGTTLRFHLADGTLHEERTHTLDQFTQGSCSTTDLAATLSSAVQLRLRSDVPVGIFLSGGVDSSAITGYAVRDGNAKNVVLFCGDTGHGQDVSYAAEVARAIDHPLQVVPIRYDDHAVELIREMTTHYELPLILTGNSVGMYAVYRAAAAQGLKVMLDGTGGDEVFCGYIDYYGQAYLRSLWRQHRWRCFAEFAVNAVRFQQIPLRRLARMYLEVGRSHRFDDNAVQRFWRAVETRLGIVPTPPQPALELEALQQWDMEQGRLPGWLYMNDMNSMAHSIEARSPLLDYRLIKYVSLPAHQKIQAGFNKFPLRAAMPDNLPSSVRWRRDKQGFRWRAAELLQSRRKEINDAIERSTLVNEICPPSLLSNELSEATRTGVRLRLYALAVWQQVCGVQDIHAD